MMKTVASSLMRMTISLKRVMKPPTSVSLPKDEDAFENHKKIREDTSISGQERKTLLQTSKERVIVIAIKARLAKASGSHNATLPLSQKAMLKPSPQKGAGKNFEQFCHTVICVLENCWLFWIVANSDDATLEWCQQSSH
jgi:hypothetical protein